MRWYFLRILLIDLEIPTLKIDFFLKLLFENFVNRFQNNHQSKTESSRKYSLKILFIDSKTSTIKIIHLKLH